MNADHWNLQAIRVVHAAIAKDQIQVGKLQIRVRSMPALRYKCPVVIPHCVELISGYMSCGLHRVVTAQNALTVVGLLGGSYYAESKYLLAHHYQALLDRSWRR